MKYAVDRIIEDIVVLEDLENGNILEVNIKKLPDGVHEGSIIIYKDDNYTLDTKLEENRRTSLRDRLNKLKRNE